MKIFVSLDEKISSATYLCNLEENMCTPNGNIWVFGWKDIFVQFGGSNIFHCVLSVQAPAALVVAMTRMNIRISMILKKNIIQVSNLHCNQRLVLLLNLLHGEYFQIERFLIKHSWISQYSNLNMCAIFFQYVMPWPKEITFFTDSFTRNRFHRFKFYGGNSSTGDLRHKHVVAILRNVRKELFVSSGASWDDEDIFQGGEVGHGIYSTLHSVWGK